MVYQFNLIQKERNFNIVKIYLLFNKNNHSLVSATDNITNFPRNTFLVKEIDTDTLEPGMKTFNLARYRWEGDYETGKLVDLFAEKKSVVLEQEIDEKYYNLFFRKYNLEHVLFRLIQDCLSPEFEERRFLMKLLEKKQKEIEFYKGSENHIYETVQEQEERVAKSFEV